MGGKSVSIVYSSRLKIINIIARSILLTALKSNNYTNYYTNHQDKWQEQENLALINMSNILNSRIIRRDL